MYRLPSDPKVDVIKRESLIQVCFGANDLFLNFSGDISFGIYSCIGIGTSHQNVVKHYVFSEVSKELLQLLSAAVTDISWATDGTISITFEGGSVIELYDDSEQFESYTIKTPSGLIVV